MQYHKLKLDNTIIEFHNNWLGQETVIVNGHIVSKKSSVWGTNHYFTVMEKGHNHRYILTTRIDQSMQVVLDLSKDGEMLQQGIPVRFGSMPKKPKNKAKKLGLAELNEYDMKSALKHFEEALIMAPEDPEIYFHMACAYSIKEEAKAGFDSLQKAVKYHLQNEEMILNHDMLAYLRMHPAFDEFLNSGFTEYDENLVNAENLDEDDLV
ncbi:MAG: hypothetical protein AAGG75_25960 [Bacteroidota bacterium]